VKREATATASAVSRSFSRFAAKREERGPLASFAAALAFASRVAFFLIPKKKKKRV
jgi:hypothetical protein